MESPWNTAERLSNCAVISYYCANSLFNCAELFGFGAISFDLCAISFHLDAISCRYATRRFTQMKQISQIFLCVLRRAQHKFRQARHPFRRDEVERSGAHRRHRQAAVCTGEAAVYCRRKWAKCRLNNIFSVRNDALSVFFVFLCKNFEEL